MDITFNLGEPPLPPQNMSACGLAPHSSDLKPKKVGLGNNKNIRALWLVSIVRILLSSFELQHLSVFKVMVTVTIIADLYVEGKYFSKIYTNR